jgi:arabinofuranosyltransferase
MRGWQGLGGSIRRLRGALTMIHPSALAKRGPVLVAWVLCAAHAALFFWVCDDAFISFRYAEQLLAGHGLVFNVGDRVEGYTNLLWVLEMAFFGALGMPMPLASIGLSVLATAGTLLLVTDFLRSTPFTSMRGMAVIGGLLLLAVNRNVAVWTTSGLETRQFTFLVLLSIWLVRRALAERGSWVSVSLALAATELTRPEGALIAASIMVWVGWRLLLERRASMRAILELAGPCVSIVAAHYVWRYAYYGDWLPNTAYAKVVRPWPDAGVSYFGAALIQTASYLGLPLALAGGYLRWLRKRDPLLSLAVFVIGPHALYLVIIGGDHFEFRPLDFYWPLLAVGAADALGGLALWLRLRARRARAWQPRGMSVLMWSAALGTLLVYATVLQLAQMVVEYPRRSKRDLRPEPLPEVTLTSFPGGEVVPFFDTLLRAYQGSMTSLTGHAIAVSWVEHRAFQATLLHFYGPYGREPRARFPDGAVMAHKWMGIMPYHLSEVTFIDELGLTDRTVARHGTPDNAWRSMAHDRSPPPGYLERRGVNIRIERAAPNLELALDIAPYALELGPDLYAPFSSDKPLWVEAAFGGRRWYHVDWNQPERGVLGGRHVRAVRRLLDCEAEPSGWTLSGAACVHRTGKGEGNVAQVEGTAWLSTYDAKRGDRGLATASSPVFAGGPGSFLIFKLAGGAGDGLRLVLRDDAGHDLAIYRGANDRTLRPSLVELEPYAGQLLHLEVVDEEQGAWGHLLLDAVSVVDVEPRLSATARPPSESGLQQSSAARQ